MSTLRRGLFLPSVFAAAGFLVLIGLGTWQIERKAWKEALIESMTVRLKAAPDELPSSSAWAQLTPQNSEFMRVKLHIDFRNEDDALVYTSGSALRDDIKSPGYFVFTPVRLSGDQSLIVINRGYVLGDRHYPGRAGTEEIVGYVRWPETPSMFITDHDSSAWYVRDQLLMAKVLKWGNVAPFYIDQESPTPEGGLPRPAPLTVQLRNDHLQYAITWYALALVLIVVFATWVRGQGRSGA